MVGVDSTVTVATKVDVQEAVVAVTVYDVVVEGATLIDVELDPVLHEYDAEGSALEAVNVTLSP
jgi:hypothetical protein